MKVTFAQYRKTLYAGNSLTCLAWAADKARDNNLMIPVYIARPNSRDAELIAEVDQHGIRLIPHGTFARVQRDAKWVNLENL